MVFCLVDVQKEEGGAEDAALWHARLDSVGRRRLATYDDTDVVVCQVTPEPGKEETTYAAPLSLVEDAVVEGPGNIYCEYPDEASTGSCKAPLMLKSNQQIGGSQSSAKAKTAFEKGCHSSSGSWTGCGSRWTLYT